MLKLDRDFIARNIESLGGGAKDSGPRILRTVDPVAEAHQFLFAVQNALDHGTGVAGLLGFFDHRQYPRGCPAVEWPTHGANRSRQ